ncbi:hypothetical protein FOS14_18120 [Skermania sp. ID1734]|uniref:hypothetical protein n=1 Tax=Skermania sp. ID1734 TaxID=2597516 RepID=UPI00117D53F9|nr:hypothetical protein [Skermania sp. ID1734]TSD95282.1 hypothetical protein FOS14_18120 [Skermania sp. ID1734]
MSISPQKRVLVSRASLYDPDYDDEADRLAAIDGLNPRTRMALGYHEQAKKAAEELAKQESKR